MKPKVNTKCVANAYAAPNERIVEFTNGSRTKMIGGLVSFRTLDSGELVISVYQQDGGITVEVGEPRK